LIFRLLAVIMVFPLFVTQTSGVSEMIERQTVLAHQSQAAFSALHV